MSDPHTTVEHILSPESSLSVRQMCHALRLGPMLSLEQQPPSG